MTALLPLYRITTNLGAPLIAAYLRRRMVLGKEDPIRFGERKGIAGRPRPDGPLIWIHAASVGEALSMLPLTEKLLQSSSSLTVLMTTGTVTSAELMRQRLPARAIHQFVPVDRLPYVRRFLDHWRPDLVLWAESEFWPNLVTLPPARGIPMVLVNGRISPDSMEKWRRWPGLSRALLRGFDLCLAQSAQDADRLTELGAGLVRYVGNLKFAVPPLPVDADELAGLQHAIGDRPVWLAASTHPGEEALIYDIHRNIEPRHRRLLTIIVPRHPDRGRHIAEQLSSMGANVTRRAAEEHISAETDVYVADTLGELGLFFRYSPIAFMGKSLVDLGGQNPLEAAKLDCAILLGPHMWNFSDIVSRLTSADAAEQVLGPEALAAALGGLLSDETRRRELAERAAAVAAEEMGVLDAVMNELAPYIEDLEDAGAAS